MVSYRLVLLLKSGLKKDQKDNLLTAISKLVGNGEIEKNESLGEMKISYPIKRELKGEYLSVNIKAKSVPSDFSKRVMMNEDVLRHLLIKN